MRPSLALPLLLASASACRSGTWLKARSGAPFDLDRMEVALFLENRSSNLELGFGSATLVLIDDDLDCDHFAHRPDDLDGDVWDQSGLLADLEFSAYPVDGGSYGYGYTDYGYEGELYRATEEDWIGGYHTVDAVESIDADREWILRRTLSLAVFSDGMVFDTDDVTGSLEITDASDDEVKGKITHQWFRGRFSAEVCDQATGGDTGYGYDEPGYDY